MIAHGGKPRTGGGPSAAVAREFVAADQRSGKHFHAALKKHVSNMHRRVDRRAR